MAVLVTGAAGFIGSSLANDLLDRGFEVIGFDNLETGDRRTVAELEARDRFRFIEGDLRDIDAVRTAVDDVECVFHQAAIASVQRSIDDPVSVTTANCLGSTHLLTAARDAGVDRLVVASSAAVYGRNRSLPLDESMPVAPESPYALSKHWTEEMAIQASEFYDLDTVALRYFNVYGPGQDPAGEYAAVIPTFFERMAAGQQPTIYGDGEQTRDFVHVDDVVEANVCAMRSGCTGEVFNIAAGTSTSVNDLVRTLNDVLGTTIDPAYGPARSGDIRHSRADVTKAKEQLGFDATIGLQEGLRRMTDTRSTVSSVRVG